MQWNLYGAKAVQRLECMLHNDFFVGGEIPGEMPPPPENTWGRSASEYEC